MATIDTSIYSNIKPVELANPMDLQNKALTMKSLAMQNQQTQQSISDQQGYRQAFGNNITTGPDGQPTLNRAGVLSDLAKADPTKFVDTQRSFATMDAADRNTQLDLLTKQTDIKKQLVMSMTSPESYQEARSKAIALKIPGAERIPPNFDPAVVKAMQMQTMSESDQLSQQNKDRDYAIEHYKTFGGAVPSATGAPAGAVNPPSTTRQRVAKASGSATGSVDIDPATLVNQLVPPAQQQKAFDEIDAAQNTTRNASKILDAFDNAANRIHAVDFVPGMSNADQKALHALMGPTFKDVEGTVRQAAMDNMNNNTTPQFGDDAATIKTKRDALVGYLTSKMSAPVAKGSGIDLSKYKSTAYVPVGNKTAGDGKAPPVDADLGKMTNAELKDYIKTHGG